MGHTYLPAAATATRTGGQGGRCGGPEWIDFLFVDSGIIFTFFLFFVVTGPPLPSPPAHPRVGRSFCKYKYYDGLIEESVACFRPN